MKALSLPVAYVPLLDAAPLIVAQEMGFAEAEGLSLDLIPAPSWSSVRDMLAFGRVDAAHMLSPIPIAMALGLGGVSTAISAVSVLSVNGDVIGVSRTLEARLRAAGFAFDFADPFAAGAALARVAPKGLTIGAPFPFSMHVELLHTWFAATPLKDIPVTIRTVPPPLMADALANGEIDAFCVGEPWGSVSVEAGDGALLLPGNAIWAFAPEKVLAVRTDWAEMEPHLLGRLMRAVWRAGQWLSKPDTHIAASEILSRSAYLDLPADLIERALTGRMVIDGQGSERKVPGFVEFHRGLAGFPWRSQAKWIGRQLGQRGGLDPQDSAARAGAVFRTDLYRTILGPAGADLPGASEKLEGRLQENLSVAAATGTVILHRDAFLDGQIFDPAAD